MKLQITQNANYLCNFQVFVCLLRWRCKTLFCQIDFVLRTVCIKTDNEEWRVAWLRSGKISFVVDMCIKIGKPIQIIYLRNVVTNPVLLFQGKSCYQTF